MTSDLLVIPSAAVLRDTAVGSEAGQYAIIQAVAPSLRVELRPIEVRDPGEIERTIVAFVQTPNGGLIIAGSPAAQVHRDLIITLAAHHQLPAVYPLPYFAWSGGLIAYGPDTVSPYRRAAGYIDRILKGEKPADLPVQALLALSVGARTSAWPPLLEGELTSSDRPVPWASQPSKNDLHDAPHFTEALRVQVISHFNVPDERRIVDV